MIYNQSFNQEMHVLSRIEGAPSHADSVVLSKITSENKELETRLVELKKEELDLEKMRTSISAKLEVLT